MIIPLFSSFPHSTPVLGGRHIPVVQAGKFHASVELTFLWEKIKLKICYNFRYKFYREMKEGIRMKSNAKQGEVSGRKNYFTGSPGRAL